MDGKRLARLKSLVAGAIAQPPEDRAAWLAGACAGDPDLHRAAATLLAGGVPLPSFLASDAEVPAGRLFEPPDADAPLPERIGPYVLHDVLGAGGMGIVVRATQEAPLRREVAVKLVRGTNNAAGILARFESERQTLARLDHPCIARVFDAGSTPDGRPYFVMEHVAGLPITAFADEVRLPIGARLELFLAVCAGVQHAHQKGIIHRDLKPSNILVTTDTGEPRPRIIDFGIAKAVEDPAAPHLTRADHLIGTPEYMSPEQAGVIEAFVDTRTDVYALGVVLYELLSGARPYRVSRTTPAELQRVLGGPPPARPSLAAPGAEDERGDRGAAAERVAAARRTTPERLRRTLRGDLDNIALKALAREPALRYGSVQELADDIRHHLAGRPVGARAATWRYRADRFVRRHAWPVATAAAIFVLLAASTAVTAMQSVRIADERDRARREAATAEAVSEFLVQLFRETDPARAPGDPVTAREILDRGAGRIERDLSGQPVVQARFSAVVGEAYYALGLYEPADQLLRLARGRYEALAEADPDGLADVLETLAEVAHDRRDMERSLRLAQETVALRRQALGDEHADVARALVAEAIAMRNLGQHAEAEAVYREALAMQRRLLGPRHADLAATLFNLGWALHQQGRVDEAEPLYQEAIAMQRALLGNMHPDVAGTLNNIAAIAYQRGRFDEARARWQEALDIYTTIYGDAHEASARAYHNLAHALSAIGEFEAAEASYRRAVGISLDLLGPDHPNTATTVHSLGVALWRLGRFAEAEETLRRALAMRIASLGEDARQTALTRAQLARLLIDRNRASEAERIARRAADAAPQYQEFFAADAASMIEALALALAAQERHAEARPLWERVVALRASAQNSGPAARARAEAGLGAARALTGDRAAGLAQVRDAAARLEALLPAADPDLRLVRRQLEHAAAAR